jgi:hypothetical protein
LALLLVGSAVLVLGLYLATLVMGALQQPPRDPLPALTYYQAVVLKGLLPQLLLTLALHPLVRRARVRWATPATRPEAAAPDRSALLLELLIVSALAYCAVAPFLLTVELGAWPALQMTTSGQQVTTFVLMTGSSGLAAWLPLVLPGAPRFDAAPGAA